MVSNVPAQDFYMDLCLRRRYHGTPLLYCTHLIKTTTLKEEMFHVSVYYVLRVYVTE